MMMPLTPSFAWPNRITLTGFMGCGKTTLGKRLAKRLNYTFIDTDAWIENTSGKTISEIFASEGEVQFRQLEQQALQHALTLEQCVIATGGGALVREPNLAWALAGSTVVYIELPLEELLERVLFSPKDRPLIDVRHPEVVVSELFEQRLPFYQQAQVHLNTYRLAPQESVEKLLTLLSA
jgi:shikimate kinase